MNTTNTECSVLVEVAELLADLGCRSYSIHATDTGFWADRHPHGDGDGRPNIRLSIVGRTQYDAVCTALEVTPKERIVHAGQRAWHAEADTKKRRLLIEGVSFQHHDDWEPRPSREARTSPAEGADRG